MALALRTVERRWADGIDIKQIKKADLRRSLAFVLQDSHLFSGSIRDNIRYGRLDATDVGIAHSGKTVGNHKHGAALHQAIHTLFNQRFRAGVDFWFENAAIIVCEHLAIGKSTLVDADRA